MKKMLYMILGCFGIGMGAAGTVIPILPTIPFLMLSAFCFARSSRKLDRWFKNTKLYKSNLEDFAAGLFGMILDHIPAVMIIHRAVSIALVFFLAIHIFLFHKKVY